MRNRAANELTHSLKLWYQAHPGTEQYAHMPVMVPPETVECMKQFQKELKLYPLKQALDKWMSRIARIRKTRPNYPYDYCLPQR